MTSPEGGYGAGGPGHAVAGGPDQAPEGGGVHGDEHAYQGVSGLEGGGAFGTPGATSGDIYDQPAVPRTPAGEATGSQPAEAQSAAAPASAPAQPGSGERTYTQTEMDAARSKLNAAYNQGLQDGGGDGGQGTGGPGGGRGPRPNRPPGDGGGPGRPQKSKEDQYKENQENLVVKNEATELAGKRIALDYIPNGLEDLRAQQARAIELKTQILEMAVQSNPKEQEELKQLADNLDKWDTNEDLWLLKPGDPEDPNNWGDAMEGLYVAGDGVNFPGIQRVRASPGNYVLVPALKDASPEERYQLCVEAQKDYNPDMHRPPGVVAKKDLDILENMSKLEDGTVAMPVCLNDYHVAPGSQMGFRIMYMVGESKYKRTEKEVEHMREVIRRAVKLDAELRAEMASGETTKPSRRSDDPELPDTPTEEPTDDGEAARRRRIAEDENRQQEDDKKAADEAAARKRREQADSDRTKKEEESESTALAGYVKHINDVAESDTATQQERISLLREIDGDPMDPEENPGEFREVRHRAVKLLSEYFAAEVGEDPEVQAELQRLNHRGYGAVDEAMSLLTARATLAHSTQGGELLTTEEREKAFRGMERDARRAIGENDDKDDK